jgi:hypothetical protein
LAIANDFIETFPPSKFVYLYHVRKRVGFGLEDVTFLEKKKRKSEYKNLWQKIF